MRELVRAPMREALQAGYDLGYRAGQEAQRRAAAEASIAAEAPQTGSAEHQPASAPPVHRQDAAPLGIEPVAAEHNEVQVEVGPFPSFSAVNRFHAAVAAAPGVADATIATFRDGQLSLRVVHPDGA